MAESLHFSAVGETLLSVCRSQVPSTRSAGKAVLRITCTTESRVEFL